MTAYEHAPLIRHAALAPFSRDHYTGLVQARHLIKAAEGNDVARRQALSEFVDAWDHDIARHFRDEERLLLPLLDASRQQRLQAEHEQLTDDAATARQLRRQMDPDANTLREIGQRLEQHIRWEERELFEHLQQQLADEQLKQLTEHTAEIERTRPRHTARS